MKRIFPIITVLIFLSLMGLIFFQFLWLRSAKEVKEQQLQDNINKSVNDAAEPALEDDDEHDAAIFINPKCLGSTLPTNADSGGAAKLAGYLEDYAFLADAMSQVF